jgi:Polysaccharide lyase
MCNRFALDVKCISAVVLLAAFALASSFAATPKTDTDTPDPEASTHWNKTPQWERDPDGAYHAIGLKSFEGIEEPTKKFVVADGKAESDDFVNITDVGDGVVRMTLRYRSDWWDGDQATGRKDRQRAEVKGLGPHQKTGETFEYGTTFRTDPDFKGWGRFCHLFQIKATDGDKGAPLVTMSIMDGDSTGAIQYYSGNDGFKIARKFVWHPGKWQTMRIRVKMSQDANGELIASVNGDEFSGVKDVPFYRPDATDYRPKWGFYRGTVTGMHDDWVEHKDQIAHKLSAPATQPK